MREVYQRLELRQSQRLTITPQVRQSIEMLQLSNLEMTDFITAEMEQNPLLEWRERELGEHTRGDHANGGGRASGTTVPEMLTGGSPPTGQKIGNRNGERIATARWISAASRSLGTAATEASTRRGVPSSTRPQPGRAPCASTYLSK